MLKLSARPAALSRYLAACRARSFRPGVFECALFAADWVVACGGRDLAASWRGEYRSIADGLKLLRAAGYRDHVDVARKELEVVPSVLMALPGDIAVIPEDGIRALGIVAGPWVHVLALKGGLGVVPLTAAAEVFRP